MTIATTIQETKTIAMHSRVLKWLAISLAITLLGGCGNQGLSTVPVSGKVSYAGGAWPAAGNVTFSPLSVAKGLPRRPGSGKFQTDGSFEVTSFKPGDGLVPGTYSVRITCFEQQPSSADPSSFERFNCVPGDFKPKDVVVDPEADSVLVEFDVPQKRK